MIQDPMPEQQGAPEGEWRKPVLDLVLHWMAILGTVYVAIIAVSLALEGVSIAERGYWAMFAAYAGLMVLRWHSRLAYEVRALGFCVSTLLMSGVAMYSVGVRPGPLLLCVLAVIAAQLFLGRRSMIVGLWVTTIMVAVMYELHQVARTAVYVRSLDALRFALGYALPSASIALLVAHVVGKIEHSLRASSEALRQLQVAEAARRETQDILAQTEEALVRSQKLEAVGRLAAGVGHDFNNTLQVVLSWVSLLRDERDPRVIEEGLGALEEAALAGSELTQRLLSFGRREVRAPSVCPSGRLVQESARSLARLLPEDIRIDLDVRPDAPHVLVDAAQISHVLLNLGVNARDAMPTGGVLSLGVETIDPAEASVRLVGEASSARYAHIWVRDTGTGMEEAVREHVFEPFFTTKGERGTGLGLATAYAIVAQSSGFMHVESEVGRGSTFHIYLPEHTPVAPEQSAQPAVESSREAAAVMVAEDDRHVRVTMVRALELAGYRVYQSSDAASALAQLEAVGAEIDVLCTDGVMPGGGTRHLIERYLARRPGGQVIVCSGYVQEELLRRDIDARAFEFLAKPFKPSELIARIDELSRKARRS